MTNSEVTRRFADLTTPHVADACLRLAVAVRCAPSSVQAVVPGGRTSGRVCPTRHVGSVDVFLEAFAQAETGDVLVVDNGGRTDESCVGDLVVLEAQAAGLSGVVIWGLHRDTADIRAAGLPVFSSGTTPTGPLRLDERPADALRAARIGEWSVGRDDFVLGDDDGVIFIPQAEAERIFDLAESIRDTERRQAGRIRQGITLHDQLDVDGYLDARANDPALTFREHLRAIGGAIEE